MARESWSASPRTGVGWDRRGDGGQLPRVRAARGDPARLVHTSMTGSTSSAGTWSARRRSPSGKIAIRANPSIRSLAATIDKVAIPTEELDNVRLSHLLRQLNPAPPGRSNYFCYRV